MCKVSGHRKLLAREVNTSSSVVTKKSHLCNPGSSKIFQIKNSLLAIFVVLFSIVAILNCMTSY